MNAIAPPFPTNPAVGEWFGNWVWNGVRWVCGPSAGVRVNTVVFTASGPYMPSSGLVSVIVECVGGGGGGGAVGTPNATDLAGGGGGGSGGYSRKTLPAALVMGGVSVTVGAGGIGNNTPPDLSSQSGGTTSFGALCVANGGAGGESNSSSFSYGEAGQGGAAGVGDVANPGNPGFPGTVILSDTPTNQVSAGGAGGSIMGGAGISFHAGIGLNHVGNPGTGPGAGGAGAAANQVITPGLVGGNGYGGICIVTEYCWADVNDECMNPPLEVNARVAVTHVPWPGPGPCPPGWGQGGYIESDE